LFADEATPRSVSLKERKYRLSAKGKIYQDEVGTGCRVYRSAEVSKKEIRRLHALT
jgi:hypothetical protein